ncbi:hypothetical protein GCM10008967_04460 [Bacillus carboniphilus]|uniref:Uncharacterized protein n=1 Tax=Bacillus carboniphilus TaxID=86663 RepID=A0ABN0VUC7_9BACI
MSEENQELLDLLRTIYQKGEGSSEQSSSTLIEEIIPLLHRFMEKNYSEG